MNASCLTKIPVSQSLISIWKLKPVNINSLRKIPHWGVFNYSPCPTLTERDTKNISSFLGKGDWQLQPPHYLTVLSHFKLPKVISLQVLDFWCLDSALSVSLLRFNLHFKSRYLLHPLGSLRSGPCHGISQEHKKLTTREQFHPVTMLSTTLEVTPAGYQTKAEGAHYEACALRHLNEPINFSHSQPTMERTMTFTVNSRTCLLSAFEHFRLQVTILLHLLQMNKIRSSCLISNFHFPPFF